jgi:O-antigen/teichoic acid export membrane protein
MLHVAHPLRLWPLFTLRTAGKLVSFGAILTITRVLWYAFSQVDILIAGKVLGNYQTGLYFVAVHLASLPMQHVQSVANDVAFSAFAKIQHDKRAVAANLRLAVRLLAILAFPALWGLAAVAPEIVHLAMGPQWLGTVLPLQIIAMVIPLRMIGSLVSTAIISIGRVKIAMITMLIGVLLAPPLFYFGTRYGIIGLSMVWIVVTPLMLALNLARSVSAIDISITQVIVDIWRPLLASSIMVIALFFLRSLLESASDAVRLALLVGIGFLLYAAITAAVNRTAASEAWRLIGPRRIESKQ